MGTDLQDNIGVKEGDGLRICVAEVLRGSIYKRKEEYSLGDMGIFFKFVL